MDDPKLETAAATVVSRRWLLARGLLGAGAVALGGRPVVATTVARARAPRSATFSSDLPGQTFTTDAAPAGWLTSGALPAPGRFDMLGLSWEAGRMQAAEARARMARAAWSRWVPLRSATDHRLDGAPSFAGTDPVWFGGADHFELRLRRAGDVRVHFVNAAGERREAEGGPSAHGRALAGTAARPAIHVAPGAPAIFPRSAWAGRGARPAGPPLFADVQLAFVHHTDSATEYGPRESAAMILGIFHFHRDVRGWGDIGYNFIVDRYGQIFEGRAGGMLEAVVGAQAGGFNQVSTGVAALGTFSDVGLNARARGALARLLAWKLAYHGVPILGRVPVAYAGSRDKFRPGARVALNRVAGHRDGNATDCPGDALYGQLPALRRTAARNGAGQPTASAEQRPTVIAAAQRIPARNPLALGGTAGAASGPLTLLVERQTARGFLRALTVSLPAAGGRLQAVISLPRAGSYRISVRGVDPRGLVLRSDPISVVAAG